MFYFLQGACKWHTLALKKTKNYFIIKHSATVSPFHFVPRTPCCLLWTASLQMPLHYCHHFLSEKRVGYSAHSCTPTCRHKTVDRYQTSVLLHLSAISAINPFLLQSCIHHGQHSNSMCLLSCTDTQPWGLALAVLLCVLLCVDCGRDKSWK